MNNKNNHSNSERRFHHHDHHQERRRHNEFDILTDDFGRLNVHDHRKNGPSNNGAFRGRCDGANWRKPNALREIQNNPTNNNNGSRHTSSGQLGRNQADPVKMVQFFTASIATVPTEEMADALRVAFKNPSCLCKLERGATLIISSSRVIQLRQSREILPHTVHEVRRYFVHFGVKGFVKWISGVVGWELDPDVQSWPRYCTAINKLQEVYLTFAPDSIKYIDSGGANKKQMFWTKQTSIWRAINEVRNILEAIFAYTTQENHFSSIMLNYKAGVGNNASKYRWNRIMSRVRSLMRTNAFAPVGAIHWAAHGPMNRHNYTLVTAALMIEVIRDMISIFRNLFFDQSDGITATAADGLGTRWYNKGNFAAAWSTEKNNLKGFATKEEFRDLLDGRCFL